MATCDVTTVDRDTVVTSCKSLVDGGLPNACSMILLRSLRNRLNVGGVVRPCPPPLKLIKGIEKN